PDSGCRPTSDVDHVQDVPREPPKQPHLPMKRPSSSLQESPEGQIRDPTTAPHTALPATRTHNSTPSPAPRTLHPALPPKQPPVPPPKPQSRNSNPLMAELCLALGGSTLTPAGSRPSPPLPTKRAPPPSSDHVGDRERSQRPASLPPISIDAPPPSPPLPSHVPPSPLRDLPMHPPPATEMERGEMPALLPLHIRIQQALSSPQPLHTPDSAQRAHSQLFVYNEGGAGEERTRVRSLPVTIELLKVPDDDDDDYDDASTEESWSPEQPQSRVYIGEVPSVTVIPSYVPPCLQEEEEEEEEEEGGVSDTDSEGPILYREEEEDEEEESSE
ncbi:hypothetical protein FKM82_026588, partial [Ascaphus truei]